MRETILTRSSVTLWVSICLYYLCFDWIILEFGESQHFVFSFFFYFVLLVASSVAGIDRYPRKVVRAMGKAKLEKRCKIKPFVKVLNYNHIMPTRYTVDIELKKVVDENSISAANIKDTRKTVKNLFQEKYRNQSAKVDKKSAGVSYFFNKLRF